MLAWDLIEFAYENRLATNEWAVWGEFNKFQYSIEKISSGYQLTIYAQVEKDVSKDLFDCTSLDAIRKIKARKNGVWIQLNASRADMALFQKILNLICLKLEVLQAIPLPRIFKEIEFISEEKYSYFKELRSVKWRRTFFGAAYGVAALLLFQMDTFIVDETFHLDLHLIYPMLFSVVSTMVLVFVFFGVRRISFVAFYDHHVMWGGRSKKIRFSLFVMCFHFFLYFHLLNLTNVYFDPMKSTREVILTVDRKLNGNCINTMDPNQKEMLFCVSNSSHVGRSIKVTLNDGRWGIPWVSKIHE